MWDARRDQKAGIDDDASSHYEAPRVPLPTRNDLLLAIGAAKQNAGRNAHRLVILHLSAAGEPVTADTFRIELDRWKLQATRRHEGQYLLRRNLSVEDPAALCRNYIHLVRIEESFRTLKGDFGLRPVFHQLDIHIEAPRLPQFPRLLPAVRRQLKLVADDN